MSYLRIFLFSFLLFFDSKLISSDAQYSYKCLFEKGSSFNFKFTYYDIRYGGIEINNTIYKMQFFISDVAYQRKDLPNPYLISMKNNEVYFIDNTSSFTSPQLLYRFETFIGDSWKINSRYFNSDSDTSRIILKNKITEGNDTLYHYDISPKDFNYTGHGLSFGDIYVKRVKDTFIVTKFKIKGYIGEDVCECSMID